MRIFNCPGPFPILLLSSLLLIPMTADADILLDDFEHGTHAWTTTGDLGNTYDSNDPSPGAAGPLRLIQHAPQNSQPSAVISSSLVDGDLVVDYEDPFFSGHGLIHGIYGGLNGIPASGSGAVEDNQLLAISPQLDLSQETELRLQYSYEGTASAAVITFYAFGGSTIDGNNFDSTSNSLQFLQVGQNNELVFPLSDLFNNVDPSQVSGIGFSLVVLLDGQVKFHHFEATGGPSTVTVVPSEFEVTRGNLVSGGLPELSQSDNVDLAAARATSDIQPRVNLEVKGVSPDQTPNQLEFAIEASVFARSTVEQFVDLWNYDTGDWEEVESGVAMRFSDSIMTATATGDLSRFVEAGTGCMRARCRFASVAQRQRFTCNIDQTFWTID